MDLRSGECNVVSLYVLCCFVNESIGLCVACLTVFVNCLVKQFATCLGVFVILLLNVMELMSVVGGALLDNHVWCLAPWLVFSVMWSDLLRTSAIICPLWSSVYECHKVECAFTSPVSTECCMYVSAVL